MRPRPALKLHTASGVPAPGYFRGDVLFVPGALERGIERVRVQAEVAVAAQDRLEIPLARRRDAVLVLVLVHLVNEDVMHGVVAPGHDRKTQLAVGPAPVLAAIAVAHTLVTVELDLVVGRDFPQAA